MSLGIFAFWPLVAVTVAAALMTALARNLVYAALSLGITLVGVSGLYFFLQAEFLAAVQLGVYVGGILILILFGVMFSHDILGRNARPSKGTWCLGGLSALLVTFIAVKMGSAIASRPGTLALDAVRSPTDKWAGNFAGNSTAHIGDLLTGPYITLFLALAVLFTVILVGALVLVRKEGE